MQRTLRIPSFVTPEAYFKVISEELARRILSRPYEADASFSTYSQALPSIESEYVTPSNICVSYNINGKPTLEQLIDGLPSEEERGIEKIYNSLSEGKRKELYDVLFYDKLITDVADRSEIKELRNKIYFSEIGKKSRKEVKRKIREEIERYLENNVKPIIEEYRKELLSRANGESDLTNVINEIFSPQNAGDYLRALEYIKKIGFHNFLEELVFENENPSSPVEYLHEAIASDAMADYLLRKGLYHISKDGALERASSYGEIFHKLSKQERKKVKEYEKKLGLRKSKAFAIGAASIILGAIGAAAYHAYKSGEKLKGDGSYFFHNPNDYIKYLKSIWNKHSNDIDNDRIPNDVEEKYGLDMFDGKDAWKDNDGDKFPDWFEEKVSGTDPVIPNHRWAILEHGFNKGGIGLYKIFTKKLGEKEVPWEASGLGFDKDKVILLKGPNATFQNYLDAINETKQKISPNDFLVIRIYGHGAEGWFGFNNGSELKDDYTSDLHQYSEIIKPIEDVECDRIIFFIDACYSGSAIQSFKKALFKSPIIVYTSGKSDETTAPHIDNFLKALDDKKRIEMETILFPFMKLIKVYTMKFQHLNMNQTILNNTILLI